MEVQRKEALPAGAREVPQQGRHEPDPVRGRGTLTELVDEEKGSRRAASHHVGDLCTPSQVRGLLLIADSASEREHMSGENRRVVFWLRLWGMVPTNRVNTAGTLSTTSAVTAGKLNLRKRNISVG